jgi:hypothetical protein
MPCSAWPTRVSTRPRTVKADLRRVDTARVDLDALELELRRLPGVRAVAFRERNDLLVVQVHSAPGETEDPGLPAQATRIATRHSTVPVGVEIVRWRAGAPAAEPTERVPAGEPRVVLAAVLLVPGEERLEVHLSFGEKRSVGTCTAEEGPLAAVRATVDALRAFSPALPYEAAWADTVETEQPTSRYLVAVGLYAPGTSAWRYGLAAGASPVDAGARATLHALNRVLALELSSHV